MPVRTSSRCPCAMRRRASASTAAAERLRDAPRTSGIDAEVAREAAAVLHLDERAHAVEARRPPGRSRRRRRRRRPRPASPRSASRSRPRSRGRPANASPARFAPQPVTYTRCVRARGAGRGLARLAHGLVRDAARVDDGDVGVRPLDMAVGSQPLAQRLGVRLRDLAAEEGDREAGQGRAMLLPCVGVGRPAGRLAPRNVHEAGAPAGRSPRGTRRARAAGSRRGRPAPPRPRARCSRPRRPRPAGHQPPRRARARSASTPFARGVLARDLDRFAGRCRPRAPAAKPSFAAAIASTPEPQPTSSRLPRGCSSEQLERRAASSGARRCRTRDPGRSRRRASRRRAAPTAARPRARPTARRGGTRASASSQPSATSLHGARRGTPARSAGAGSLARTRPARPPPSAPPASSKPSGKSSSRRAHRRLDVAQRARGSRRELSGTRRFSLWKNPSSSS